MKTMRVIFFSMSVILMFSLPVIAWGDMSSVHVKEGSSMQIIDLRLLLNTFTALAEEHIGGVLRSLKVLSVTEEVRSGDWDAMKGLLTEFSKSGIEPAVIWFARPDGSYYTVGKGLTDQNLRDRTYFPKLMAGNDVMGDLVISKSTGRRSVVIAVPVIKEEKVIGAIGASLSAEEMSRMLEERMDLPKDMVFYALDAKGQTSLHRISSLLFAFPSDMGSKTLREAVNEMLSKQEGVVRYDFFGKKIVVFKKSPLTGWVFAMGVVRGGASKSKLPPVLSELEREITAILNKMNADLATASKGLSKTGLQGTETRKILQTLCGSFPYAVDCAAVDRKGQMMTIEPAEYRKFEGSDISKQEHIVRIHKSKKPVLSKVFRAVEGFDAVDIEYPVFSPEGEFAGSVSLLIRPESLFSSVVTPVVQGLPVDVWVMQKDGRIIYDPDTEEIGRMLFDDPIYKPFPHLLSLGKTIAKNKRGTGSYEFLGRGLKEPVKKDAYWTTVGILGTEWRLVVTHTLAEDSPYARRDLAELGVQSNEESLRHLAGDIELKDALYQKDGERVHSIFKKFYESHYGLYAIQWVDAGGINLYGYPEENSPLNFDFHSLKTPSSKYILKALSEKTGSSFDAPLVEGKEGHFFMVPVYKDDVYLGMVYIIRIKP